MTMPTDAVSDEWLKTRSVDELCDIHGRRHESVLAAKASLILAEGFVERRRRLVYAEELSLALIEAELKRRSDAGNI